MIWFLSCIHMPRVVQKYQSSHYHQNLVLKVFEYWIFVYIGYFLLHEENQDLWRSSSDQATNPESANPEIYIRLLFENYSWIVSCSKCYKWRQISKLLSNSGCLFTCCYFYKAYSKPKIPSSQLVTSPLSNFDWICPVSKIAKPKQTSKVC